MLSNRKINEKILTSSLMLEILISFDCKPKILENIRIIMSECISKNTLTNSASQC
jgi:hypothetical protein